MIENQLPSWLSVKAATRMMPRAQMLPMTMATRRKEKSMPIVKTATVRPTTKAAVTAQAGMRTSPGLPPVLMATITIRGTKMMASSTT